MRTEHRIIGLSIILGIFVWIFDAFFDSFVFLRGSFWGVLIFDIKKHEIFMRCLILGLFVGFGIILSRVISRLEKAKTALQGFNTQLEARVEERTSDLEEAKAHLEMELAHRREVEEDLLLERNKLMGIMDELRRSREELRGLASHLQSVREDERTRVAREIHDELGQTLTSLSMDLVWMETRLSKDGATGHPWLTETMGSMSKNIDGSIQLVRKIATQLRPGILDAVGLIPAIEWQAARFQERTGVECRICLPSGEFQLDRDRSTGLFRIFQEILTNAARHSKATAVNATLAMEPGQIVLEVKDNGRGITDMEIRDSKAFGIMGMRERAAALGGEFRIEGVHAEGTRVVVRVPLET
jgi:signal transduction histidine kinase